MRSSAALPLLLGLMAVTRPALAHEKLKRAAPADGARVSLLNEVRLTFNEPPELTFTRIRLLDSAGREIPLSPLRIVSDTAGQVVADVTGDIAPGLYTVAWQVAGRDGHPVRGSYTFTMLVRPDAAAGGEAAGGEPAPGGPSPPATHHPETIAPGDSSFNAESPAFVVVRVFTYLALLGIIGAVVFQWLVLGRIGRTQGAVGTGFIREASRRAARLGLAAAVLLLFVSAVRLYTQSYAMHGAMEATNTSLIGAMLAQTMWGWGWLLQAGAAAVLIAAFALAGKENSWGWPIAALAAIAAAVTPALSGHAASAPRLTGLTILSDSVHVLGVGSWLGTLLILVGAGIPASRILGDDGRHSAVASLVNTYSPIALVSAGATALTGLFAAWIHVAAIPNLWQSSYGLTLLLKWLVLTGVAATGAYNWRYVRPRLGDVSGTSRISRSARIELLIAAVVIAVTAVLVAKPTPSMDDRPGASQVTASPAQ